MNNALNKRLGILQAVFFITGLLAAIIHSMMHPKHIRIEDFTYELPDEKIAYHPLANRQESKLLLYKNGAITDLSFPDMVQELPANTQLVFNNTKVVAARLRFYKATGGAIEIFCLAPHEQYNDTTTAYAQTQQVSWICLVGGAAKWKTDQPVFLQTEHFTITAHLLEKRNDSYVIRFSWNTDSSFAAVLEAAGNIPLPPYIKRAATEEDTERYQTVYAQHQGSVAAPTAGLHFTPEIMEALKKNNVALNNVTLHVGAGTFKPVKTETMEDHEMHEEWITVEASLIASLGKENPATIVATGTTSLRTLESLYWLGAKLLRNNQAFDTAIPYVEQWDAYDETLNQHTAAAALHALSRFLEKKQLQQLTAKTQIIIAPGYDFKIAEGLITNFHQPNSTLLLLVSAFIGEDWKKVYRHALDNNYRFLSYGDSSLLWRNML